MKAYRDLSEGTLAELIDNVLFDSPSPVYRHSSVSKMLLRELCTLVEDTGKGTVFHAPFDVYLDEVSNAVQPDLIVVLNENRRIIDVNGYIHGVPDFIIEILSDGNRHHDLIRKKELYERFGVKEYWIVDPDTFEVLGYEYGEKQFTLISKTASTIVSNLLQISVAF